MTFVSPRRSKQPSPEKRSLPLKATIIIPKRAVSATEAGSPTKKAKVTGVEKDTNGKYLETAFTIISITTNLCIETELEAFLRTDPTTTKSLIQSRRIELPYSLIKDGRAVSPPYGDFSLLLRLFPTTFRVEINPPFVIIWLQHSPEIPRPLTVGGLPVRFVTNNLDNAFDRGFPGRGQRALVDIDLHRTVELSDVLLRQAIAVFRDARLEIKDIFWFAGFWQITVPDGTDKKLLPFRIAGSPAFYRSSSQISQPDPAALRNKIPFGVERDDTVYANSPNALLRPGIMLSSSYRNGTFKSTTSGILVADTNGELFITVATHGFESDGLVYHPDPQKGHIIGRIVTSIPNTDISFARLNPGLRYINETFGVPPQDNGVLIKSISPGYSPHLRSYDDLTMNNPFSGGCEGTLLATGAKISDINNLTYVKHQWSIFENGDTPVEGSCGSPILDARGNVIGLFQFQVAESDMCLSVSALELREHGYEPCGGEQTFT